MDRFDDESQAVTSRFKLYQVPTWDGWAFEIAAFGRKCYAEGRASDKRTEALEKVVEAAKELNKYMGVGQAYGRSQPLMAALFAALSSLPPDRKDVKPSDTKEDK